MTKNRLLGYDVLKAYAIILVVLYHLGNNIFPNGYLGVDIFFVVNGFFLFHSINKIINFRDCLKFFTRRIVRLYPVVIAAALFCLVWGAFWLIPHSYRDLAQSVFATLLFTNNVLCYLKSGDYWAVVNDFKPLMHTWFLAVIVQFYIALPLALVLIRKVCLLVFRRNVAASYVIFFFFCGSLLLNFIPAFDATVRFYFLPFRIYEFCYGYLIAQLLSSWQNEHYSEKSDCGACKLFLKKVQLSHVSPWSSAMLYVIMSLFICLAASHLPLNVSVMVTVFLTGPFLLVLPFDSSLSFANNKYVAVIGQASFSIYIWHQVVLAFFRSSWECHFNCLHIVFLCVVIAGMSMLSYLYIESPVVVWSKEPRKYKRIVAGISVSVILLSLMSLGLHQLYGIIRDVPELEISLNNTDRVDHNAYNEYVKKYNHRFSDATKVHWLVVGDSFARDWINVLRESKIEDRVELSYIFAYHIADIEAAARAKDADLIFFAEGTRPDPTDVETFIRSLDKYGIDKEKMYVVGGKRFGYSVNQVYSHRFEKGYPDTNFTLYVKDDVYQMNDYLRGLHGNKFIDLYKPITVRKNYVRIFNDEGLFLSQDTVHLTRAGARFYAAYYRELIIDLLQQSKNKQ